MAKKGKIGIKEFTSTLFEQELTKHQFRKPGCLINFQDIGSHFLLVARNNLPLQDGDYKTSTNTFQKV